MYNVLLCLWTTWSFPIYVFLLVSYKTTRGLVMCPATSWLVKNITAAAFQQWGRVRTPISFYYSLGLQWWDFFSLFILVTTQNVREIHKETKAPLKEKCEIVENINSQLHGCMIAVMLFLCPTGSKTENWAITWPLWPPLSSALPMLTGAMDCDYAH